MENEFDLGLNIASLEAELPDPVITLTGSDTLTASDTAEAPLLNLNVYGRSTQGYASHGGEPLGKNLFPWNDYTTAPFVQMRATATFENSEIVITTDSSTATKGAYISQTYIRDILSDFDGKYITISAEMMTDMPDLSYSFGLDYHYKRVSLTDSWNRYSYSIDFVKDKACTLHFFMQSGTSDAPTIKVRNIQIELGTTLTDYEPYKGTPNPDCPVAIESVGDSGSVTVTTCGKNLIYTNIYVKTHMGIKWERRDDGTIVGNGTATDYSYIEVLPIGRMPLDTFHIERGKKYILSGCPAGGSYTGYSIWIQQYDADLHSLGLVREYGNGAEVTISDKCDQIFIGCAADTGVTVDNLVFKPMLRLASVADNTFEPYKSTTADITTGLPLRGIPVSSGGNYIGSNNQEWICDTIEHVYGKNAQAVKRITEAAVASAIDMHGGSALLYEYTSPGDEYPRYEWYFESGRITNNGSLICANYVWHKYYNRYGELITDSEQSGGNLSTTYTSDKYKLIGDWKADDGSVSDLAESPYTLDNGDAFPQEYMCETLPPVVGAKIIYPSAEAEIIPFTTKETEAFNSLQSFSGSTTVYNNTTADMTVKILREDYEMQYVYWLKESQTFICEKAGKYKIICVGGGSSGGVGAPGASEHLQAAGTTTSFGTVISAAGGTKSRGALVGLSANSGELSVGGQSGYDGINYASTSHVIYQGTGECATSSGGESTVMWGTGHGYGAGGGAKGVAVKYTAGSTETVNFTASGGQCGRIESTIVDLEEGQAVYCTVGGGGVLNVSDAELLEYIKSVYSTATAVTTTGAQVSACASDGADGVIIVQYLGL